MILGNVIVRSTIVHRATECFTFFSSVTLEEEGNSMKLGLMDFVGVRPCHAHVVSGCPKLKKRKFNNTRFEALQYFAMAEAYVSYWLAFKIKTLDINSFGTPSCQALFSSMVPSPIPLQFYITRFTELKFVSQSALVMACVLIDRACLQQQSTDLFQLTPNNVHRVFLASLLISVKYLEDDFKEHALFATIGGVEGHELTCLEIAFLRLLRFNVWVEPSELSITANNIIMLAVANSQQRQSMILKLVLPPHISQQRLSCC